MDNENMCRIPVNATMKIIDGKAVMVKGDWVDIPADAIARFLIQKFGVTPIFGGDETPDNA